MNRGHDFGEAITDLLVAHLGRLVQESLQKAEVFPRRDEQARRVNLVLDQQPKFDRIGLRDDTDVVNDRVSELPDEFQGGMSLPVGDIVLPSGGEQDELAFLERIREEAAEAIVYNRPKSG